MEDHYSFCFIFASFALSALFLQCTSVNFSLHFQAAEYLHEDCAKYPKKITYIYSPPHLACESLEVSQHGHTFLLPMIFIAPYSGGLMERCYTLTKHIEPPDFAALYLCSGLYFCFLEDTLYLYWLLIVVYLFCGSCNSMVTHFKFTLP